MLHSLGDERKKYRKRFDREGMDGGNAWRTFGKCICELKRGMKYPFPWVYDTAVRGFCRQSGITGHRLCEAAVFLMGVSVLVD